MGESGFFVYVLWALNAVQFAENHGLKYCVFLDGKNNPYWSPSKHPAGVGSANLWSDFFSSDNTTTLRGCEASAFCKLEERQFMELSEGLYPKGAGWKLYLAKDALKALPSGKCSNCGSHSWFTNMRYRGASMVKRYIRIQPHIQQLSEEFWHSNKLAGKQVLGIHMRGTDKVWGKQHGPSDYYDYIRAWLDVHGDDGRVFIATDDPHWMESLSTWCNQHTSRGQCIWRNVDRLEGNAFTHPNEGDPYSKGEEVLVDALLLSKVDFLMKSASNVPEFGIYFNEALVNNSYYLNLQDEGETQPVPSWMAPIAAQFEAESQGILTVPTSWLLAEELPKCETQSPQGLLRIEGGDRGAGFATLFFTYPINHILLAEAHCLIPLAVMDASQCHNFYDETKPGNVWEYYFEPLPTRADPGAFKTVYRLADEQMLKLHVDSPWSVHAYYYGEPSNAQREHLDVYDEEWYRHNRGLAAGVVSRYFKLKPAMQAEMQRLWERHVSNRSSPIVLGIHYRGTDKGGPWRHDKDDLNSYLPYIESFLKANPSGHVFLATDDYEVQEAMLHGEWPASVRNAIFMANEIRDDTREDRNLNGGMHDSWGSQSTSVYNRGVEALMDIMLLSKCNFIIHGESAMAEAAIWLNFELHKHSIPISYRNRPEPSVAFFSQK
eukprot:gnl/TRDRNA2_/TRDRNA2_161744_c0_seq2.p1 gnl/TRDRNA2_/TRDRNA2_161744_c0~~gnl/TRDRNA2_/TRDRNA2_161744_c0_seq2.p1  ORF type:complete len:687 (-),score=81.45 gnl/TRDRNA2_/TRDRNA2_161744_c0_seq2:69-2054(-)